MGARGVARILRWGADERGNVGPLLALLVVPLIGAFAIVAETGSWATYHRSQQNAADSAVLAAALKGSSGYDTEAYSVATKYGYTSGSNNATVTVYYGSGTGAVASTQPCPTGANIISGTSCWKVKITKVVPIYLTRVVGFNGDTALGTGRGKTITAYAAAGLVSGSGYPCLTGLQGLSLAGGNGTDLTGCVLISGGSMQCSGTNSANGVAYAYTSSFQGNSSNCASNSAISGYTGGSTDPDNSTITAALSDAKLSSLCPSYQTAPATGITSLSSGASCYQGNVSLGANLTVPAGENTLIIRTDSSGNGSLNLNDPVTGTAHSITSASTSNNLTIIWTCGSTTACASTSTSSTLQNYPLQSNGGTLDIAAPGRTSTSDFKGFTLVQDPRLQAKNLTGGNKSLDINYSGGATSSITLDISGMIYMPNGNFNINGGINHATNGYACVEVIAKTITIAGTNDILGASQCYEQGENQQTVPVLTLLH